VLGAEEIRNDLLVVEGSAAANVDLVAELHRRQAEMYAGGPVEPVAELLAEGIVWRVPGSSPIAGEHCGVEAVLAYFAKRRELASATMEMHPGEVLTDGEAVVQLVDGTARFGDEEVSWRTVGVYRIEDGRIREVSLVPLDLDRFDGIWTAAESR
jgi:ketosteroid isomerase-like protein